MVDDEDPKPAPAGNVPAGDEKPAETPVEPQPPEGEEPEGDQQQTEKEAQAELDLGGVAVDEQSDEDEGEEETDKEKSTRLQRYKEERDRYRAEAEALRARRDSAVPPEADQLRQAMNFAVAQKVGPPPNEADFPNDYVGFANAKLAYEVDIRQVRREVQRDFETAIHQEQARVQTLVSEHKERVAKIKTKIKNYDEVMAKSTMPVASHVERLLIQSKKSGELGYVLALNEAKLAQLNRMNPEDAAREIGRLEGRLSLPQSKTQTKARAPIKPLKGGGTAPPSGLSAVNALMKKMYPDRF